MMNKLPITCIGYGLKEGRCDNFTGAKSQTGRKNSYWCPVCDEIRIKGVGNQINELIEELEQSKLEKKE